MTKALYLKYLKTFHPHQFRLKKPPKKHDVIGVTQLSRGKIPVSDLMEKTKSEKCCSVLDGDTVDGRNPR